MFPQKLVSRLRDRLVESRFLTVSLTLHAVLLLVLATVVVVKPLTSEPDMTSAGPLVTNDPVPEKPPQAFVPPTAAQADFQPQAPAVSGANPAPFVVPPIVADMRGPSVGLPPVGGGLAGPTPGVIRAPEPGVVPGLSRGELDRIRKFTDYRGETRSGSPTYEFTAYIGQYQGGNWQSTVRLSGGKITGGSLPNLLYVTSKWSKDRIKTNERNVKAIPLDSDEIFTTRPPFLFLTGTRDFVLTDKEVENLQKYVRLGGAIWGDSSVPGRRSAFDRAFEREMKRVLGIENGFEALPENHPVLTQGYFPKVKNLPAGINHYKDPVRVMRWGGEIAVIHTTNDYGDMWQIGLDKDGRIDLSRDKDGRFVAMNETLWANRGVYVRNVEQPAVEDAYKFGINMIFHLITRWESRTANSAPL